VDGKIDEAIGRRERSYAGFSAGNRVGHLIPTSTWTSSSTGSTGARLEAAALLFCRLMQQAVATTQKLAK
jgi:hypothetical protein